jgi:GNAT superfamily N-acetyltransferase
MSDVTVRVATEDDVAGVAASSAALFAEDAGQRDALRNQGWPAAHGEQWVSDLIGDGNALVLVADAGGDCVGHLVGTYQEASEMWLAPRAELVSMLVRRSHRCSGAGAALVDAFKAWAKGRGAMRLEVVAYAENEGALRFYARNGFVPKEITLVIDG